MRYGYTFDTPDPPHDFRPGDIIARRLKKNGEERRLIVQDPVRTNRGKVRVCTEGSTYVQTAWWVPDRLPEGYSWRRP